MREYAFGADVDEIPVLEFDVVIAGSGAAGLYAALNLDPRLSCALLNKLGPEEANSMYAQGGIASVTVQSDCWESHFKDTLKAGAGLCDEEAVKVLVREGPSDMQRLIEYGVPFDRDENDEIILSKEGAHSCSRILHCGGDKTGYHLTGTLSNLVRSYKNITCFHHVTLVDVLTDENSRVTGGVVQDQSGKSFLFKTPCIILATGGIGRVYRNSTNSGSSTGDGIAAAHRAGAELKDMEFVQFHPTALIHPDMNMRYFLISEALRGEGAILRNRNGDAFMQSEHPMADLAPRDIVSRAIIRQMKKYDLPNVYLDITMKPRPFLKKRFPVIYHECMRRGIDIAATWIPVVPVQHYFMGGIKTDLDGKTNVEGLYACGESACTGVHGANRLASNSLLECLVFGRRCAQSINGSTYAKKEARVLRDNHKPWEFIDFETYRFKIRNTMTKKGGIVRNIGELTEAAQEIGQYSQKLKSISLNNVFEIETLNMATVALEILKGAIGRDKSAGAHYRSDDPGQ